MRRRGPKEKFWLAVAKSLGPKIQGFFELPLKLIYLPFTLPIDIAGSAPRGFGVPEFISKLSGSAVVAVATLGVCDIALDLGRKVLCTRSCHICNGWQALQCTMCKGTGKVMYQVKNYTLRSGQKATAESIADAITENRAKLVHLPAILDLNCPLPSKDCPTCDGSGVMGCPECKGRFPFRISADDIVDPPRKAYNIMKKMHYPLEHIIHSMKDPNIAAFWLVALPQVVGGFDYDDDVKQKLWWQFKENMRYDQLRDVVAERKPGWEYLQKALISIDPARARDDPIVVKNIPYYKAKYALETEVMKLEPPPRPQNWGELNLPLDASSWSEDDLKDPKKLNEMTVLLNAQREIAVKILDSQWETEWRQQKLSEMLEEKVKPYVQNLDGAVLPRPIILKQDKKKRRRWWLF